MVNGEQCTICWYVDDSKILYVDSKIVDWAIENIEKQFGKMTVKRGKQHTFVGMDIIFTNEKTVPITMKGHIKECFEAFHIFDEEISKGANTPVKSKLFEIDEHAIPSNEIKNEGFHHIVAKLLFVS